MRAHDALLLGVAVAGAVAVTGAGAVAGAVAVADADAVAFLSLFCTECNRAVISV